MNSASTIFSNGFLAVFWGGLACGVLDITQAFVAWGFQGVKPLAILRHIASGLLGDKAFKGGLGTAVLGTALHFLIAFGAAAVYYAASRRLIFLTQWAVLSGLLYGEAVFLFMHFIVVPLSAAQKSPFSIPLLITGPIGHMFLVGLPIAVAVRRYSG